MNSTNTQFALSRDDQDFRRRFEACEVEARHFHHRDHIRLAYIYLVDLPSAAAHARMRRALRRFLDHHGVDPAKYHETMTRAWIQAVAYFMALSTAANSADEFIEANARLLDADIMLTHYSRDLLFSERARLQYLPPDLSPIP